MSDVDQLIERYLDDRDSLSDEELSALVEALRGSDELACEFKNQMMIDELIAQRLTVDRANFPAQMQQRVNDLHQGDEALDRQVAELRDLAASQYQQWTESARPRASRLRRWLAAVGAVCALLLAAAGVGYFVSQSWGVVGQIEMADGSVSRIRDGRTEPVRPYDRVLRGDRLHTFSDGHVQVRYRDGSLIDIAADTLIEFQDDRATGAKRLLLEQGELAADVVRQPSSQRMVIGTFLAEATVLGTNLLISAGPSETRLDVIKGAVELTRVADQARVTVKAQQFGVATSEDLRVDRLGWPSNDERLVFLASGDYRPHMVVDPLTGQQAACRLTAEGEARLNHDFAMELRDGQYLASDATSEVARIACRESGEATFEAIVQTADLDQSGGRLMTLSRGPQDYEFYLAQKGNRLVLGLKTTVQGQLPRWQETTVHTFQDRSRHHLVVSYRDGQTVCFVDGEKVSESAFIVGDFRDWTPGQLVLGDDPEGGYDWAGSLEGVAIYSRFMHRNEARRNSEYYHFLINARQPVPQVVVRATLLQRSKSPDLAEIAPARSTLVMSRYRVDEVLEGDLEKGEILVDEWSILNNHPQPLDEIQPGDSVRLVLEHVEHNPQLGRYKCWTDFKTGAENHRTEYYAVKSGKAQSE